MFCHECGSTMLEGARFCGACGTRVPPDQEAQPTQELVSPEVAAGPSPPAGRAPVGWLPQMRGEQAKDPLTSGSPSPVESATTEKAQSGGAASLLDPGASSEVAGVSTLSCGYCQADIADPSGSLRCPGCGTNYHRDCWAENEGCAIPGCSSAPGSSPTSGSPSTAVTAPLAGVLGGPAPGATGTLLPTSPPLQANPGVPQGGWAAPAPTVRTGLPTWLKFGIPIAVVALIVGGILAFRTPTHELSGTYTLLDSSGFDVIGSSCYPSGGYGDILPSTQVTVRDASGTILAATTLGQGTVTSDSGFNVCQFSFDFGKVPVKDLYEISSGTRGSVTFTKQDLVNSGWVAQLTIGQLGGV